MRKFIWRSLVAVSLCASVGAQEPEVAPPAEVDVEIPMEVLPIEDVPAEAEVAPVETEILPEDLILETEPVQIELTSLKPEVDVQIEHVDSPDVVVVSVDVEPPVEDLIFWSLGVPLQGTPVGHNADAGGLNELELLSDNLNLDGSVISGNNEITVPEELTDPTILFNRNGEEEHAPNLRNNVQDLQDESLVDGDADLAVLNTLGPGTLNLGSTNGELTIPTINLDRINTEFRNRTTGLIGPAQTVPRGDLLSQRDTAGRSTSGTTEVRTVILPQLEVLRLSDTQRDYARQLADVDALRDQALKTGNVGLLQQAESIASRIRKN